MIRTGIAVLVLSSVTAGAQDLPLRVARGRAHAAVGAHAAPAVVRLEVTRTSGVPRLPKLVHWRTHPAYHRRPAGPVTGVLISPTGHILTSAYNLGGTDPRVVVHLADGRQLAGRVLSVREAEDVTVLKVEAEGLPFLRPAATSGLRVGQETIVVSRGAGPEIEVTAGILGAVRDRGMALQFDARTSYGSSGAPVLDLRGRLIGMVTRINHWSDFGQSSGLSFAASGSLLRTIQAPPPGDAGLALRTNEALTVARAFERARMSLIARVLPACVMIGSASGVLISADGEMLTNDHVTKARASWRVVLPDRRWFTAEVVGRDPRGDLCLLRLKDATGLPHVSLGSSETLRSGQLAIAIGNPRMTGRSNFQPAVSAGVVSATGIYRLTGGYTRAVQTDAAVSSGSSGGALLDSRGRLVGLVGQILPRFGTATLVNSGLAYAVPVDRIRRFLPALRRGGTVKAGDLMGVSLDPGYRDGDGVRVSASTHAQIETGDVLCAIDGVPVTSPAGLRGLIASYPATSKVRVTLRRQSQRLHLELTLGTR